jgi:hypothetical protein
LLLCGLLLVSGEMLAQDDNATTFPLENFYAKIKKRPRSILRNVKFGLSVGYGNTFVSNKLDGFGIYQAPSSGPSIFASPGPPVIRYSNWISDVAYDTRPISPSAFNVLSDTAKLGFKGNASNIPIKATIHYEFAGKYRIGGGYSYELMNMGSLHSISYSDKIASFTPPGSSGWMSKYFGLIGVSFYRINDYLFTGDAQIGGFSPGGDYNSQLVKSGVFVNVGVTAERELSEYLRVFARPSFEMKSTTLNVPEGGPAISTNMNAFYFNIGLSYSIPDLPKCFIKDCKIQMNHAHGDREYRSRVHPFFKKQNPQYGENHPRLIKYKGKNKKKLNPY